MKWSQLKKRIEATFADSVAGRVEVWNTRYRKSHDDLGEGWITIDKQLVLRFAEFTHDVERSREAERLQKERECTDYRNPDQNEEYRRADSDAQEIVQGKGVFGMWQLDEALFGYLNMSIDDAIESDNPIIRAFAILDRRFGKRRLKDFDSSSENPLVRTLHRFRCDAEGIKIQSDPTANGDK